MKIGPSFQFRFREFLNGAAVFLMIYILVMSVFYVSVSSVSGSSDFSGFEISAAITVFVFGIVTIREDLRLGIQNGVGRRSVFLAALLSSVLVALILAVVGDLIVMAAQGLTVNSNRMYTSGLFQLLFFNEGKWFNAPFQMHLGNVLFIFSLLVFTNLFGSLISLVFYRLNKLWTVIVAVGTPLLLFWILPLVLYRANIGLGAFLLKIAATPVGITAFFAVSAALVAVFNFLLIRRAPIKSPVK